jgi:hypothetical protein
MTVMRLADRHDDAHVVFDQQHGVVAAQVADQRGHHRDIVDAHARSGLVEHQQGRLGADRHAHFQHPLLAVGQLAGQGFGTARELQAFQHLVGSVPVAALVLDAAPEVQGAQAVAALGGQAQVFAHERFWNRLVSWNERAMPSATGRGPACG